ncbi:MAG: hypothetical protein PHZ14_10450 [Sulfuricella sp.]|jgi:hypothetical protein|nr:hypothetical protein [Sulfuricella sp.]
MNTAEQILEQVKALLEPMAPDGFGDFIGLAITSNSRDFIVSMVGRVSGKAVEQAVMGLCNKAFA